MLMSWLKGKQFCANMFEEDSISVQVFINLKPDSTENLKLNLNWIYTKTEGINTPHHMCPWVDTII